ncbi:MAG: ATP-binding protein [Gammaproteobacteria bacterium]
MKRSLAGNVDIRIKTSQGLHTALVDSNQLESAILNLCINSRDAMPLGGEIMLETMNITLGKESTGFLEEVVPGDYVAIKVTDNGAGIPQHLLGRVFEPFFTTKDLGKGTGLGLSTVYGFLRQSNGYITIASTLGIGTEVILYLPITLQQEKHPDKREQRPRYAGGNELILLVEDDAAVSSFASQFLSSLGYTVLLAASGEAALVLLKQRNDIVMLFTDIIMPGGMDGGELAKKALELDPALKVLYTSGYTDNALIKEGNLDPNVNFLTKPYTLNTMANRIRETLDRGKSDNAVGREKPPG